jgi:hypothetical protein
MGKRNEHNAYALIQTAVAVFAAGSGESIHREYWANFNNSFCYDPASKAERKGLAALTSSPTSTFAEPSGPMRSRQSIGRRETEGLAGYTAGFNDLLLKATLNVHDQYCAGPYTK